MFLLYYLLSATGKTTGEIDSELSDFLQFDLKAAWCDSSAPLWLDRDRKQAVQCRNIPCIFMPVITKYCGLCRADRLTKPRFHLFLGCYKRETSKKQAKGDLDCA